MSDELDRARRLVAHREMQLLRASAARFPGRGRYARERGKKLAEARAYLARLEARAANTDPCPECEPDNPAARVRYRCAAHRDGYQPPDDRDYSAFDYDLDERCEP